MSQPQVIYHLEYISGGFALSQPEHQLVRFYFFNRGSVQGRARAMLFNGSLPFDTKLEWDNGDAFANPGELLTFDFVPQGPLDTGFVCARLLTTSSNIVPSIEGSLPMPPEGVVEGDQPNWAYFSPGDFAVFPLHPSPFPPIGPVETGGIEA